MRDGGIFALLALAGVGITYGVLRSRARNRGYAKSEFGATIYGVPYGQPYKSRENLLFQRRLRSGQLTPAQEAQVLEDL